MIVAEQSTKAFSPHHVTRLTTTCSLRRDALVVETLMIALGMIVINGVSLSLSRNWLRVLDTTERPQIDQDIGHQLHPIVSLLDAFKS
jgi:hypothetical protein